MDDYCAICDESRDLVDGVCRECWREHAEDLRAQGYALEASWALHQSEAQ